MCRIVLAITLTIWLCSGVFVSKHKTDVRAFFSTGSSVENTAVSDVNRNVVFQELLRNFIRS